MTLQQSFLIDPLLASMLDGLQEAVWLLDAQTLRVVLRENCMQNREGFSEPFRSLIEERFVSRAIPWLCRIS